MVDAAAGLAAEKQWESAPRQECSAPLFLATVHDSATSFLEASAELELFAPPQSVLWVSTWLETVQPDAVLVTVRHEGRVAFALGLQCLRKGAFKIARVLGLSHANANFFPISSQLDPVYDLACVQAAIRALQAARPDIHAIVFERLAEELDGRRNPVLQLPSQTSPNIALSLALTGDFDAVLDGRNGARKRKRQRYHRRKLEALGAIQHVRPKSAAEVRLAIDAFFAMKAERLRELGIADVFGQEPVRDFFRLLYERSASLDEPQFVLDTLLVGGQLKAVTGSSIQDDRLICDFSGFAGDETASASPGDYLLYENIRQATLDGFSLYDLGVGDEPYKRSWCDIETRHHDVFVALTAIGSALGAAQRAKTRVKTAIKNNRYTWQAAKSIRSILTGRKS